MKTPARASHAFIATLVTIFSAIAAGAAWAQPAPGPRGPGMMGGGPGMMGTDPQQRWEAMQQRHARRMQDLEKELDLRPEQQAAWKAFLEAQTAWLQSMHTGWRSWNEAKTTPERFDAMARSAEERLSGIQRLAERAHALYAALDAQQKATLDRFTAWRGRFAGRGPTP